MAAPLHPARRAAIVAALQKGLHPTEVARDYDVHPRTIHRLGRQAGVQSLRAYRLTPHQTILARDAELIPALRALDALPFAARRAMQLKLARAHNNPRGIEDVA